MKKIIIIKLMLFSLLAPAQNIGWNMVNATRTTKTLSDSTMLQDLTAGNKFIYRFRYDKGESQSNVNNQYEFESNFEEIFVANMKDKTASENYTEYKKSIVPIKYVSAGNESFYPAGGFSFIWADYEPKLIALCEAFKYENVTISVSIAPRPKELGYFQTHSNWNNGFFKFKKSHPEYKLCGDIHLYYGEENTDNAGASLAKRNYNPDVFDAELEDFYTAYYNDADVTFFDRFVNYLYDSTNNKIIVTESGYVNTGAHNGTFAYSCKMWELLNYYGDNSKIDVFCLHAGLSLSQAGASRPRKTYDIRDANNLNNVTSATWDAEKLYFQMSGTVLPFGTQITKPGTYTLWYSNPSGVDFNADVPIADGLVIESNFVRCVSANHIYSPSCNVGWTDRGSILSFADFSEIKETDYIPKYSFGWVQVQILEVNNPPVCIAIDNQTVDKGTTAIFTGSYIDTDVSTVQWTLNGAVLSNSLVLIYTPASAGTYTFTFTVTDSKGQYCSEVVTLTANEVECYKKRWLFSGCKKSKTVCNC